MDCPYPDCAYKNLDKKAGSCPQCSQWIKTCGRCNSANRAFANFCRSCGQALAETPGDWTGFKGGVQCLGLNPARQARPLRDLQIRETLAFRLDDRCGSLLAYDRHLIAVSQEGRIEVVDAARGGAGTLSLRADAPITSEPCISSGILYIGGQERVAAYSLGGLTLAEPNLEPLWTVRLSGTPVRSLLALDNCLYFTVVDPEGHREVQVLNRIDRDKPGPPRSLYAAESLSWLAANPASRQLFFLSEEEGGLWVHRVERGAAEEPELTHKRIPRAPQPLVDPVPVAVMGAKIFAVLGQDDNLCRLDAQQGLFDTIVREDAKAFSLSGIRDGVQVGTGEIAFLAKNVTDRLNPNDRVKGSPVLLRDCAAALGMQDGRLRLYDLQNPPRHEILRLSPDSEVTALASFHNCIAAGDSQGLVKVFSLSAA